MKSDFPKIPDESNPWLDITTTCPKCGCHMRPGVMCVDCLFEGFDRINKSMPGLFHTEDKEDE